MVPLLLPKLTTAVPVPVMVPLNVTVFPAPADRPSVAPVATLHGALELLTVPKFSVPVLAFTDPVLLNTGRTLLAPVVVVFSNSPALLNVPPPVPTFT